MPQPGPALSRPLNRVGRLLRLGLLGAVVAFAVTTVPGIRQGFVASIDGWLQGGGYVLAAVVAGLGVLAVHRQRVLWGVLAAAVATRALGVVVDLSLVQDLAPPTDPVMADAWSLASSMALLVGLGMLMWLQVPELSTLRILDALLAGAVGVAAMLALLDDTLRGLARSSLTADVVLTNLAQPLADVGLLMVVVALLATAGWRPSLRLAMVTAGVAGIAAVDAVSLHRVAVGTYEPGTPLAALSLAATAAVAWAPWLAGGPNRPPRQGPAGLVVPALFAIAGITILALEARTRIPLASTVLACVGLAVAIVRAFATVGTEQRTAAAEVAAKQLELQRFRALVEASDSFIGMAQTDGTVIYINPAGRRMVGLPPDTEVTTTTITDYLTPESAERVFQQELPAVLRLGSWVGESTMRDLRGGPPIPVLVSSFMMTHPETGEPWLLATVRRDISERLEAERALSQLANQRQELLGRLVEAEEQERTRIAADVHDDTVQALAAVELRLMLLHRELEGRAPDLLPAVGAARETVGGATERLRGLLFDLESPAQRMDLAAALEAAASFVLEGAVSWSIEGELGVDLPEPTRVTAYRIAKEALVNVRKHADARHVRIELASQDGGVEIAVCDDGSGFDPVSIRHRPGHLGIVAMRERAAIAGGVLHIGPDPDGGTIVRLWLPGGPPEQDT